MDFSELNVLITAASRRVALIRSFRNALKEIDSGGVVVSSDINPLSPGLYVSDRHYFAPLTDDPGYSARIMEICKKENISAIIPTIDNELELMGQLKAEFHAEGISIIISSQRTSEICNDKWQTYHFFKEQGIQTPETWLPENLPTFRKSDFPLFLKPRFGRGSIGTYVIRNQKELCFFVEYVDDPIIQQYLGGKEYTLDTFCDFDGEVISVVPRERLWVRSGVMDKGRTVNNPELIELGVKVATELNTIGPVNIQVKYHQGIPMVFEVNPRFSGGIPLTINAGANFPLWICQLLNGQKLKPRLGEFTDGLVMMSFEDNIFKQIDTSDFESVKRKLM
jgi:carbamoyl-phosphate synthase large subunit